MKSRALHWTVVALICLLATGCKDYQEPVKPITACPTILFVDL